VKHRIAVMLGFKKFRNAAITIAGIELLHRIRNGCRHWNCGHFDDFHGSLFPDQSIPSRFWMDFAVNRRMSCTLIF